MKAAEQEANESTWRTNEEPLPRLYQSVRVGNTNHGCRCTRVFADTSSSRSIGCHARYVPRPTCDEKRIDSAPRRLIPEKAVALINLNLAFHFALQCALRFPALRRRATRLARAPLVTPRVLYTPPRVFPCRGLHAHGCAMAILEAPFDPLPSHLLLGTSAAVLMLSIASLLADAMPGPPPRGEPKRPERTALACALLLRLVVAAAIIMSLVPGTLEAVRYLRIGPLAPLASQPVNTWMHSMMRRAVEAHVASSPGTLGENIKVGVGSDALNPSSRGSAPLAWGSLLVFVVFLSVCGAVLGVFAEDQPVIKGIFVCTYISGFLWFFVALLAAFVRPTALPQDETPLRAKWFDRLYETQPSALNETRLLSNWVAIGDYPTANGRRKRETKWLSDVPDFQSTFCELFNADVPRVTPDVPSASNDPLREAAVQTPAVIASPSVSPSTGVPASSTAPASSEAPPTPSASVPPILNGATRQLHQALRQATEPIDATTLSNPEPPPGLQPIRMLIVDTPVQPTPAEAEPSPLAAEDVSPSQQPWPAATLEGAAVLKSQNLGELLVVYVGGRGIGTGPLRALGHFAGGLLIGAPVAAAQALARRAVAPVAVGWALAGIVLALRGTPTLLRPAMMPVAPPAPMQLCGREYIVRITDAEVSRAAKVDVTAAALLFIALLVRGYAWLRVADNVTAVRETHDVKLVDYDEIDDSAPVSW